MARRRRSAGPEVSLFPFLSILACLIGALTILIVALGVSEILGGRKDEAVARAEDYVILEKEVRAREAERRQREEELQQMNQALAELAEIEPRVERVKEDVGRIEQAVSERETLRERVEELRGRRAELADREARVEAGLAEGKQKLGELARQLARGMPLRVLATSDFVQRAEPVFVEAREEGLVVHSPSQVVPVARGEITTDPKFRKVIDFVARRDSRLIVFLVRSDGRASYYAAESYARDNGAMTSKVPLVGTGEIDLKQFFGRR